ncbi:hypothetical protein [Streptomyces phaeochromogenes]
MAADLAQELIEHVERGQMLDLATDENVDEAAMRSWGRERTVPADALRNILRGKTVAHPDPHGLQLRGAHITGCLDLRNLTTEVGLELHDCLIDEGLVARATHLPFLVLDGSLLEGSPDEAPLSADRLTTVFLSLGDVTITSSDSLGAVQLVGAHIGNLHCFGAKLRNDSGPALDTDSLQVDHAVFLTDGFEAVGGGDLAAVGRR